VTGVSRKPALFAGFLLLTVALITSAQDYVDVEAERRAEEAAQNGAVVTPVAPVAHGARCLDLLRYSTLLWDDNGGAGACRRDRVTRHWR